VTGSSVSMTKVLQSYIIPKQNRWIFEELSLREDQTELFYYFFSNTIYNLTIQINRCINDWHGRIAFPIAAFSREW